MTLSDAEPIDIGPIDLDICDVGALNRQATAEGTEFVGRLVREWHDTSNRFDGAGEVLLGARVPWGVVAVGGLNRDPYVRDRQVGRLRHLYVMPAYRRRSVGRALVAGLLQAARGRFRTVRLRAAVSTPSAFYLACDFLPTGAPDATHEILIEGAGV